MKSYYHIDYTKMFLFGLSFANMPNSCNNNELQVGYGWERRLREIMKQTIDRIASNSKTKQNAFHKCQNCLGIVIM